MKSYHSPVSCLAELDVPEKAGLKRAKQLPFANVTCRSFPNCCLQVVSLLPRTQNFGQSNLIFFQNCTEHSLYLYNPCANQNCTGFSRYLSTGPRWELICAYKNAALFSLEILLWDLSSAVSLLAASNKHALQSGSVESFKLQTQES